MGEDARTDDSYKSGPALYSRVPVRPLPLTVDLRSALGADEAVPDVLPHEAPIAPSRIAVPAPARRSDPDHVTFVHLERGDDGIGLDRAVGTDHLGVVRRTVATAGETPGRVAVASVRAREEA